MSIFSERLKWLRERKNLTQKDMSIKLDMSHSNYTKYEYGTREPTIERLAKLPEILGESVDFIIGVTDYTRNAEKIYEKFYDASAALSVVETNKERELWKERMEIARKLLLNMLDEIPKVKEQTYKEIRNDDGWITLVDKTKDSF